LRKSQFLLRKSQFLLRKSFLRKSQFLLRKSQFHLRKSFLRKSQFFLEKLSVGRPSMAQEAGWKDGWLGQGRELADRGVGGARAGKL